MTYRRSMSWVIALLMVLGQWLGSGASAPTAPMVHAVPASIPADCSRDVASMIGGWIASVPDNSVLTFRRDGCYKVEGPIRMVDRSGLVIDGGGARFRRLDVVVPPGRVREAGGDRIFWFVGGRDIVVRGLRIEGTNRTSDKGEGFGSYVAALELEHGLAFQGVQGVTVEDVTVDAVFGDGIYLGRVATTPGHPGTPTTSVRISRVTIDRNGRQGIGIAAAVGVLIEDVKILHSRRAGVDLEPAGANWRVANVEVRNTYIRSHLIPFAAGGRGEVSDVYIHDNTIDSGDGTEGTWVHVTSGRGARRQNWRVYGNRVIGVISSPRAALIFGGVDNVDIRRNVSHLDVRRPRRVAVEFRNAGGRLFVVDNDFTGACAAYVADRATGPVVATGNIVDSCPDQR